LLYILQLELIPSHYLGFHRKKEWYGIWRYCDHGFLSGWQILFGNLLGFLELLQAFLANAGLPDCRVGYLRKQFFRKHNRIAPTLSGFRISR
jgi:hypothetical protein